MTIRRDRDRDIAPESDALKEEKAKREQAETRLQKALDNFDAIFENSPDALMIIDAIEGTILKANQMVTLVFGYKASELKGKNFKILFPSAKEQSGNAAGQDPQFFETAFTQEFECADGSKRFMDMTSAIIKMDHGISILAAFRDISKRVRMEKRLRESRQKHLQLHRLVRLITDHATDYIWAKDPEQRFLFINRTMSEKLLNCNDPEEVVGHMETDFLDPITEKRSEASAAEKTEHSGSLAGTSDHPIKYLKKGLVDGKSFVMDVHESPIFNEKHQVIGTVGIGRDITATDTIKERSDRRDTNRPASSNLYSIVDDFNNLVAEMTQMIRMAQSETPLETSQASYLKKALEIGEQSTSIMERFDHHHKQMYCRDTAEDVSNDKERILFVDIEEAGAEVSKQILEHLGYQTEAGSDPEKALEEFRANPESFDLVITDMTLPKMSGEILASEILKIKPDIPIIFCTTGYKQPQIDINTEFKGIAAVLIKPLVMSEIAQTVRNVLDKSHQIK